MQNFQNMYHSNFQGLTRASNFFPKFKDFQGLLKDPMDPVYNTGDVAVQDTCYNQKLTEGHLLSREITENLDSP